MVVVMVGLRRTLGGPTWRRLSRKKSDLLKYNILLRKRKSHGILPGSSNLYEPATCFLSYTTLNFLLYTVVQQSKQTID